jgi:hypothetical protein
VKPAGLWDDQYLPVRFLWSLCPGVPKSPAPRWLRHSTRTGTGPTVMSMSNESTPQVPAEPPRPALPQFDPGRPAAVDDTQQLPSASTSALPVTPPATPYAYAAYAASPSEAPPIAGPGVPLSPTGLPTRDRPAVAGAPAADGPRWTAKKTAVTAGLALVLASAGAIGAAAAMPAGSTGDDSGFRGPGGGRNFPFPGGQRGLQNQQNQQGTSPQQLPNLQNGLPGGGLSGSAGSAGSVASTRTS